MVRRSETVRDALADVAAERVHLVHPLLLKAFEMESLIRMNESGATLTPFGRALLRELELRSDLPSIE